MLNGNLIAQSKGQFAQAFVTTLLEHAGYIVRRLGVEEVAPDIRRLGSWDGLSLPPRLMAIPDLLVIDEHQRASKLIEVKYRKHFTEGSARSLSVDLKYQREFWPESWAIIVLSEPPGGRASRYQDYLRVVHEDDVALLDQPIATAERWRRLPTIGSMFQRVHDVSGFHTEMDKMVGILEAWGNI